MLRKETCHPVWKIELDLRTISNYQTIIYTKSHGDTTQICFALFSPICFTCFTLYNPLLHYTYTIYVHLSHSEFICIVNYIKHKFVQSLIACTTTQTSQESFDGKRSANDEHFLRTEKLSLRRACNTLNLGFYEFCKTATTPTVTTQRCFCPLYLVSC